MNKSRFKEIILNSISDNKSEEIISINLNKDEESDFREIILNLNLDFSINLEKDELEFDSSEIYNYYELLERI